MIFSMARFDVLLTRATSLSFHQVISRFRHNQSFKAHGPHVDSSIERRTENVTHRIIPLIQERNDRSFDQIHSNNMPVEKDFLPKKDSQKITQQEEAKQGAQEEKRTKELANLKEIIKNIREYNPIWAHLSEDKRNLLAKRLTMSSPDHLIPGRGMEKLNKEVKVFETMMENQAKAPLNEPSPIDNHKS